jgi:LysM repeat protein
MIRLALVTVLIGLLLAADVRAADPDAPRVHTVWYGQRLGSIAKRYNVSVEALCNANAIDPRETLHAGQKLVIPARDDKDGSSARQLRLSGLLEKERSGGGGVDRDDEAPRIEPERPRPSPSARPRGNPRVHVVVNGQRLASIAKRYEVSVEALCNANDIRRRDPIKPKQVLIIPAPDDEDGSHARAQRERGALGRELDGQRKNKQDKASSTGATWQSYRAKPRRRGYVNLVGYHQSWKGYALGQNKRVLPQARRTISAILTPMGHRPPVDERLIRLLVQVSDTFGGRALRIVSGYRGKSYVKDSRHKSGKAIDFSIIGVPNEALRDYLRTFDDVGVGYYPNSTFVHLDVRDHASYWVDYSGPGEAPRYAARRTAKRRNADASASKVASDASEAPDEPEALPGDEARDH